LIRNPVVTPNRSSLDALYALYNQREYVHPDPLEFLYRYDDLPDREIAGLIASCLAYGRVVQILRSVCNALDRMGPSPYRFLLESSPEDLQNTFADFRHRFTSGTQLAALLIGMKKALERYGSLYQCFLNKLEDRDSTILPALTAFVQEISEGVEGLEGMLLPSPAGGSACKRLNLFLRWMARSDDVDPGGWERVRPSRLIIPLDVHMHRISLQMGLTARKQADMRTALEITEAFRSIVPEDPVRYDFALTRLGICYWLELPESIQ
jgi:uncharacterized protein (TIGR02757 family)